MKPSYEEVYNFIKNNNCELLDKEYINERKTMAFKCHCGNIFYTTFARFKKGHTKPKRECDVCSGHKMDLNKARQKAREYNCELIDSFYNNSHEKHNFRCICGNTFTNTINKLNKKNKCNVCTIHRENSHYLTEYEIRSYIKKVGLKIKKLNLNIKEKSDFICECGNEFSISISKMRSRNKIRCNSCTAYESGIETLCRLYLEEKDVKHIKQYKFKDLKSDKGAYLRFDFALFDDNNKLVCLIELDGEQHYIISHFAPTQAILDENKKRDELKNNYCLQNKIMLFRIPYWDFNKINTKLKCILNYVNLVPSSIK